MTDPTFTLLLGDTRERLRELSDESVHAVVTSPPYWQLRDYGTEPQAWGGDAEHAHEWGDPGQVCECGAWRGELGQEPHPDLFVDHLVEVFEEVRRVLRKDGVAFVNIDDTYCANRSYQVASTKAGDVGNTSGMCVPDGLKEKELALVPQRLALALQRAGWWVRCDVIWAPPNGMPESVTDRPTRSHEYVFMLTKASSYFWDKEAVKEQGKDWSRGGPGTGIQTTEHYGNGNGGNSGLADLAGRYKDAGRPQTKRAWELFVQHGLTEAHLRAIRAVGITDVGKAQVSQSGFGKNDPEMQRLADEAKAALGGYYREFLFDTSRNLRSVWQIPTESFYGAHYAVMAVKLAERMISAATSEKGCCSKCGAQVERVVERESLSRPDLPRDHPEYRPARYDDGKAGAEQSPGAGQRFSASQTVGWKAACSCAAELSPSVVLDPFGGAATTALAAKRLGRSSVIIELSEEAADIGSKRMETWWKDVGPRPKADDSQLVLL